MHGIKITSTLFYNFWILGCFLLLESGCISSFISIRKTAPATLVSEQIFYNKIKNKSINQRRTKAQFSLHLQSGSAVNNANLIRHLLAVISTIETITDIHHIENWSVLFDWREGIDLTWDKRVAFWVISLIMTYQLLVSVIKYSFW